MKYVTVLSNDTHFFQGKFLLDKKAFKFYKKIKAKKKFTKINFLINYTKFY